MNMIKKILILKATNQKTKQFHKNKNSFGFLKMRGFQSFGQVNG